MAKKRADGRYQKSFRLNGKKYVVYGKNSKELCEREQEKRAELAKGIEARCNPTVEEYYDRWLIGRQGTVSEATLRTQGKIFDILKKIRIPSLSLDFGKMKIKQVTIDDLRTLQAALKEDRKTQTVNDYLSLLKHIFSDAKKERIIDYNPCELLNNLKRTEEKARNTHHRALSLDEQKKFFAAERCKNSYYNNIFKIAILTGMRIGEIGALMNSDIKGNVIHVERTITRTETGAYIVGESAKTESGRRTIPMNDKIKSVIAEQKNLNTLLDGKAAGKNELVFKSVGRKLLMATPIDREIKRICKDVNIEHFKMHAFRVTFATRAIESGMNPKTLQEILGHSNFNLTMSLYGHCLMDTKKQAMDSVNIDI